MRYMYTCFECEIDNICYAVSCDVTLMELVCKTVTLRWLLPVDSYCFFWVWHIRVFGSVSQNGSSEDQNVQILEGVDKPAVPHTVDLLV